MFNAVVMQKNKKILMSEISAQLLMRSGSQTSPHAHIIISKHPLLQCNFLNLPGICGAAKLRCLSLLALDQWMAFPCAGSEYFLPVQCHINFHRC
jgi:hypothetical protein